jgi:hypothetical protein
MSFTSPSQTYRIATRSRTAAVAPTLRASGSALAPARKPGPGGDDQPADNAAYAADPDRDSVRRSPLLRALFLALQAP